MKELPFDLADAAAWRRAHEDPGVWISYRDRLGSQTWYLAKGCTCDPDSEFEKHAEETIGRNESSLLSLDGVFGLAAGCYQSEVFICLFVRPDSVAEAAREVPDQLDGFAVYYRTGEPNFATA